ncbi:MAG: hypothetical protein HYY06_32360 [Deltaproteobacteria bacterium]|nr:hypothetical protein [Deltaproteobacteria bacterium]
MRIELPLWVVVLLAATPASAQEAQPGPALPAAPAPAAQPVATPAPEPPRPGLVHVPPGLARSDEPILLELDLTYPERVERADVHYRTDGRGPWKKARIRRASSARWGARIPRPEPNVRSIDYYVTITEREGRARTAFGDPSDPHTLVVRPTDVTEQEARELEAHEGQRLEFLSGGEYTSFGNRADEDGGVCSDPGGVCHDYWYSLYGAVRYHFYRGVRSVQVRVDRLSGLTPRERDGQDPVETEVGLVAATAEVELRLSPDVSLYGSGIIGANEVAVQPGAGAMIELGVDNPTRIQLAVQGIADFGVAGSAWMRWYTIPRTPLGAGIEITNQPGSNRDVAVRLLFEAARHFGPHFTLVARGGYGARDLAASGFSAGGYAQLSF